MADPVPRVNFEVMQRCIGSRVILVGEVKGTTADGLWIVRSSDDAEVHVQPNHSSPASWNDANFVEVMGVAVDSRTIQEESHVNMRGPALDLKLYNELVKLQSGKYAQLFA